MRGMSSHGHRSSKAGGQLSLAGFDASPQRLTDRLFFAIFPDTSTAECVTQLAQRLRIEHQLQEKPYESGRFHVTLHHLGDYSGLPQGIVTAALQAAATVKAPPFELAFDRALSFSRGRDKLPFVLCGSDANADLMVFQRELGVAMAKAGLGRWVGTHYNPHLTLLRDKCCVAEQTIEAVAWTAREFVLVHSLMGKTKYVPLGRWPLLG
jgi:RNA 2',3'-cyclic 3'-phosphodiesterase